MERALSAAVVVALVLMLYQTGSLLLARKRFEEQCWTGWLGLSILVVLVLRCSPPRTSDGCALPR